MKQYTLFLVLLAPSFLYCMENPVTDKQESVDDYNVFDDQYFANGDILYTSLITHKYGREVLLTARVAERRALNSAHIEHRMGIQRFKPCEAFGRRYAIPVNEKNKIITELALRCAGVFEHEEEDEAELAEAIADTEYYLIEQAGKIKAARCETYEMSRRDDIILLKKIIESDSTDTNRVWNLIQRVRSTSKAWPPEGAMVCPLSAYTILLKALDDKYSKTINELNALE